MTSALHFLAQVACDPSFFVGLSAGSPSDSPSSSSTSTSSIDLHIPCSHDHNSEHHVHPLRQSSSTNARRSSSDVSPSPSRSRKVTKRHSPDHLFQVRFKQQMRARRQMLMEKAMRIKSLDNSPVNDHQLLVLRMVYDQITMYPSESWMVLLAIVIRRAFKQVKNWFSNERQKNKEGRTLRAQTKEGDKVRLRPMALQQWDEWSDAFFEEVIMIYDYKVLMDLRVSNDS